MMMVRQSLRPRLRRFEVNGCTRKGCSGIFENEVKMDKVSRVRRMEGREEVGDVGGSVGFWFGREGRGSSRQETKRPKGYICREEGFPRRGCRTWPWDGRQDAEVRRKTAVDWAKEG